MQQLGGYEIIEKIGTGGMGSVYRGRQVSLDRPVAIKVLSKKVSDKPEVRKRFNRESQIIARLNHPNIIHVIDRGVTKRGMPYFVMEHIEGTDLSEEIKAGKLDTNQKLELSIQVCKALSYAHKNGVIHRDIKPANVLIDNHGNALVLDFGIAKLSNNGTAKSAQTQAGMIMGTFEYMSPEQRSESGSVTAGSDLYSLGAVMYELFTGMKPCGRLKPPSEIDPSISTALETIILRCLEPEASDRFRSADEIKDGLLQVLQGAHLPHAQKQRANTGLSSATRFDLLDVIKEDDYGAVYLYQDTANQRLLVIKKRTNTTDGLNEAKILTNLKHKNIVNILGASGDKRLFILVMEYLSGGSLKDRMARPQPWVNALKIGKQISSALSFAHRNRFIHGNLRPSNILFTEDGQVKLSDFGLDEHYRGEDEKNWYSLSSAPKSLRSDIYAIGVILYQMVTGLPPLWRHKVFVHHHNFNLLPLKVQELVTRMIVQKKEQRFQTVDEVLVAIDGLLAAHEQERRRIAQRKARKNAVKPTPVKPRKLLGWRLVQTFILLSLLLLAAFIYLQQKGEASIYINELTAIWQNLAAYIRTLI